MQLALIAIANLADLDYPRYKYMVQVVMGEQRGEGVRYGPQLSKDPFQARSIHKTFRDRPHQETSVPMPGPTQMLHEWDDLMFRCGCRCFWDSDVDRHASETFMNVSCAPAGGTMCVPSF